MTTVISVHLPLLISKAQPFFTLHNPPVLHLPLRERRLPTQSGGPPDSALPPLSPSPRRPRAAPGRRGDVQRGRRLRARHHAPGRIRFRGRCPFGVAARLVSCWEYMPCGTDGQTRDRRFPPTSGFAAGARSAEPGPPDSPVGTVSLVAVHGTVLQARVDTASPFRNEEWTLNAGPKLRVGRPSYSA